MVPEGLLDVFLQFLVGLLQLRVHFDGDNFLAIRRQGVGDVLQGKKSGEVH